MNFICCSSVFCIFMTFYFLFLVSSKILAIFNFLPCAVIVFVTGLSINCWGRDFRFCLWLCPKLFYGGCHECFDLCCLPPFEATTWCSPDSELNDSWRGRMDEVECFIAVMDELHCYFTIVAHSATELLSDFESCRNLQYCSQKR